MADLPSPKRLPRGSAALLAAILPSLLVWFWKELPPQLEVQVLLFLASWLLPGAPILAGLSARPRRDALLAGALVVIVVLLVLARLLVSIYGTVDPTEFLFSGVTLGSLALGCAAQAGFAASRISSFSHQGSRIQEGRALPIVSIVAGSPLVLVGLFFLPGAGFGPSFIALLALLLGALFVGLGWFTLTKERRHQALH